MAVWEGAARPGSRGDSALVRAGQLFGWDRKPNCHGNMTHALHLRGRQAGV